MKKFVLLFCMMFLLGSAAIAGEVISNENTVESQNRIDYIGFKILNSNGIEKRTVFRYDISRTENAYSRNKDRQIVVYRGLYNRLNTDDELAAVLAHEISHSVDSYNGVLKGFFSPVSYAVAPKKHEYKADKRAVDYMVNAGYNPVALIVVMNKVFPQARYDWYSTHPLTSRRMMAVYEYIYKKYPEFLAKNSYKDDMYYQNFLLNSKTNRAKFQKKIETNSKKSVNYQ